MKRLLAAGALTLAAALAGCSAISTGYITDKGHSEAYYTTSSYCMTRNAKAQCTMWGSRQDYHPPRWWFDLRQSSDGLNGEEPKTGWVNVSQTTYDAYDVGDYYGEDQ